MTGENEDKPDVAEVDLVQVKLPPFWMNRPSLWFARVEAQFKLRKITTEDTKFYHTMSALSQELLDTVLCAVEEPDEDKPYTVLKDALIARHGPHKPSMMMDFILAPPISPGQDPCRVYDRIRALKIGNYDLEAGHFCAKMPEAVRHDVMRSVDDYGDLKDLANAARHLMKKSGSETINQVSSRFNNSDGKRKQKGLCYNHRRYGEKAWDCRRPCAWTGRRPSGRPQDIRCIEDHSGNDEHPC